MFSCTCVNDFTIKQEIDSTRFIFSGRVIDIVEDINITELSGTHPLIINFEVLEFWKGMNPKSNKISIVATDHSCLYPFQKDSVYLVFSYLQHFQAYPEEIKTMSITPGRPFTILQTDICTKTKLLNEAREELKVLGAGKIPKILVEDNNNQNQTIDKKEEEKSQYSVLLVISFVVNIILIILIIMGFRRFSKK